MSHNKTVDNRANITNNMIPHTKFQKGTPSIRTQQAMFNHYKLRQEHFSHLKKLLTMTQYTPYVNSLIFKRTKAENNGFKSINIDKISINMLDYNYLNDYAYISKEPRILKCKILQPQILFLHKQNQVIMQHKDWQQIFNSFKQLNINVKENQNKIINHILLFPYTSHNYQILNTETNYHTDKNNNRRSLRKINEQTSKNKIKYKSYTNYNDPQYLQKFINETVNNKENKISESDENPIPKLGYKKYSYTDYRKPENQNLKDLNKPYNIDKEEFHQQMPSPSPGPTKKNINFDNILDNKLKINEKNKEYIIKYPFYINKDTASWLQNKLYLPEKFKHILSEDNLILHQKKDPLCNRIIRILTKHTHQNQEATKWIKEHYPHILKEIKRGIFSMKENRLIKNLDNKDTLFIPTKLIHPLLQYEHTINNLNHPGIQSMYLNLKQKYTWPFMFEDIQEYVHQCRECQYGKGGKSHKSGTLANFRAKYFGQRLHFDFAGPFYNKLNVLLIVDSFTGLTQLIPTTSQKAEAIIHALISNWIPTYGFPTEIISDQGKGFTAIANKLITKHLGIKKIFTSKYHPESNAMCERRVLEMKKALRMINIKLDDRYTPNKLTSQERDQLINEIVIILPSIQFAINQRIHTVTQLSPHMLVFGKNLQNLTDIKLANQILNKIPAQFDSLTSFQIKNNIQAIIKHRQQQQRNEYEKYIIIMKNKYDLDKKEDKFKIGDKVAYYIGDRAYTNKKIHGRFSGPFTIISRIQTGTNPYESNTVKISNDETKETFCTHIRMLKKYHPNKFTPLSEIRSSEIAKEMEILKQNQDNQNTQSKKSEEKNQQKQDSPNTRILNTISTQINKTNKKSPSNKQTHFYNQNKYDNTNDICIEKANIMQINNLEINQVLLKKNKKTKKRNSKKKLRIFRTNFPSFFSPKDLRTTCTQSCSSKTALWTARTKERKKTPQPKPKPKGKFTPSYNKLARTLNNRQIHNHILALFPKTFVFLLLICIFLTQTQNTKSMADLPKMKYNAKKIISKIQKEPAKQEERKTNEPESWDHKDVATKLRWQGPKTHDEEEIYEFQAWLDENGIKDEDIRTKILDKQTHFTSNGGYYQFDTTLNGRFAGKQKASRFEHVTQIDLDHGKSYLERMTVLPEDNVASLLVGTEKTMIVSNSDRIAMLKYLKSSPQSSPFDYETPIYNKSIVEVWKPDNYDELKIKFKKEQIKLVKQIARTNNINDFKSDPKNNNKKYTEKDVTPTDEQISGMTTNHATFAEINAWTMGPDFGIAEDAMHTYGMREEDIPIELNKNNKLKDYFPLAPIWILKYPVCDYCLKNTVICVGDTLNKKGTKISFGADTLIVNLKNRTFHHAWCGFGSNFTPIQRVFISREHEIEYVLLNPKLPNKFKNQFPKKFHDRIGEMFRTQHELEQAGKLEIVNERMDKFYKPLGIKFDHYIAKQYNEHKDSVRIGHGIALVSAPFLAQNALNIEFTDNFKEQAKEIKKNAFTEEDITAAGQVAEDYKEELTRETCAMTDEDVLECILFQEKKNTFLNTFLPMINNDNNKKDKKNNNKDNNNKTAKQESSNRRKPKPTKKKKQNNNKNKRNKNKGDPSSSENESDNDNNESNSNDSELQIINKRNNTKKKEDTKKEEKGSKIKKEKDLKLKNKRKKRNNNNNQSSDNSESESSRGNEDSDIEIISKKKTNKSNTNKKGNKSGNNNKKLKKKKKDDDKKSKIKLSPQLLQQSIQYVQQQQQHHQQRQHKQRTKQTARMMSPKTAARFREENKEIYEQGGWQYQDDEPDLKRRRLNYKKDKARTQKDSKKEKTNKNENEEDEESENEESDDEESENQNNPNKKDNDEEDDNDDQSGASGNGSNNSDNEEEDDDQDMDQQQQQKEKEKSQSKGKSSKHGKGRALTLNYEKSDHYKQNYKVFQETMRMFDELSDCETSEGITLEQPVPLQELIDFGYKLKELHFNKTFIKDSSSEDETMAVFDEPEPINQLSKLFSNYINIDLTSNLYYFNIIHLQT